MERKRWVDSELTELETRLAKGKPVSSIAIDFDRTPAAVENKTQELGLSFGPRQRAKKLRAKNPTRLKFYNIF